MTKSPAEPQPHACFYCDEDESFAEPGPNGESAEEWAAANCPVYQAQLAKQGE